LARPVPPGRALNQRKREKKERKKERKKKEVLLGKGESKKEKKYIEGLAAVDCLPAWQKGHQITICISSKKT
jgi:hypothetical protein